MKDSECSCYKCQGACQTRPGWFMPGEAEIAAQLKGLGLPEFFTKYLGVDWYEGGVVAKFPDEVFVLAPIVTDADPGTEYPADPRGQCIFFEGGKCSIYEARPYECRKYRHEQDQRTIEHTRTKVVKEWQKSQQQIIDLLGREPQSEPFLPSWWD